MKAEIIISLQLTVFRVALQCRVQSEWVGHSSCEFQNTLSALGTPPPVAILKAAAPWGQNATLPGAGQGCKWWWELPLPTAMASWVLPRESMVG